MSVAVGPSQNVVKQDMASIENSMAHNVYAMYLVPSTAGFIILILMVDSLSKMISQWGTPRPRRRRPSQPLNSAL